VVLLFSATCFGCTPSSDSSVATTGDEATPVAFNLAGAPTVEFSVPDMMCPEGCGVKTKEILSEQPGAKEVVIVFEAKTAIVAVETDKFEPEAAIAALVDHGFENSSLKSHAAQSKPAAESLDKQVGKPAG
jgi:copper chaperone CopZ